MVSNNYLNILTNALRVVCVESIEFFIGTPENNSINSFSNGLRKLLKSEGGCGPG